MIPKCRNVRSSASVKVSWLKIIRTSPHLECQDERLCLKLRIFWLLSRVQGGSTCPGCCQIIVCPTSPTSSHSPARDAQCPFFVQGRRLVTRQAKAQRSSPFTFFCHRLHILVKDAPPPPVSSHTCHTEDQRLFSSF